MTVTTLTLPKMYPAQRRVIMDSARIVVIEAATKEGRRIVLVGRSCLSAEQDGDGPSKEVADPSRSAQVALVIARHGSVDHATERLQDLV
ncbi:MAG: hypothetical protein EBY29_06030 [Planctomycetes bacterium]|nr:hypothetical protein [Planctomycetota bacterium]